MFGAKEAEVTIATNVRGTAAVTAALAPALRARGAASAHGARVVNVCSSAGKLRILRAEALAQRFRDAATEEQACA